MVQIFNPAPVQGQAGQLGQALGAALGQAYEGSVQRDAQQQQQSILAKVLTGEATQEDLAQLNPQYQAELMKLQMKPPAGGISAQPVPQEVSQKIPEILNANKEANADELAAIFDENKIPRAYSNSYIENRRRQDEMHGKQEIKREETARREQIEFHKEQKGYDEGLSKRAESSDRRLKAIERQEKRQPEIGNWDRFFVSAFKGSKFEDLFKSQSAQEFDAAALPLLEGMKEVFGSRITDADLRIILQKIATSQKDPEANKTILEWLKLEANLDKEKRKIADEIKKENKGLRPIDFEEQVRNRFDERFGEEIDARAQNVMKLADNEKEIAKFQREKVPPGTPLSTQTIDKYLKMADGDPEKASELAKEDGYEF